MIREVLYSPGYGGGWSSNEEGEIAKLMLTYQPIIDAINNGQEITRTHPLVKELKKECRDRFGKEPYVGMGVKQLRLATVDGLIRIDEYDGYETIVKASDEVYM